jgi:hypothetical protein
MTYSAEIDNRVLLHELYLLPYEMSVKDGPELLPSCVRTTGSAASTPHNSTLTEVLRNQ